MHIADSPGRGLPGTPSSPRRCPATSPAVLDGLQAALGGPAATDWSAWVSDLRDTVAAAVERDAALLGAEADPIHPARIYGELVPRLAPTAARHRRRWRLRQLRRQVRRAEAPRLLAGPGPYGCLGAGLGSAIAARLARPSAQVVVLLGDGAAGCSLMDVDTLVRHNLPVVMVMGGNSAWGLEKGPMQMLYGYDVIADLAPRLRRTTRSCARWAAPGDRDRPAPDRRCPRPRLRVGVPYLVNVITDVEAAYPRATFGI